MRAIVYFQGSKRRFIQQLAGIHWIVLKKDRDRLRFSINQENLEFCGVDEQAVYDTIAAIIGGVNVGYSERGFGTKPIAIDVKLPRRAEWIGERFLSTPLAAGGTARQGKNVELGGRRHRKARACLLHPIPLRRPLGGDGTSRGRWAI